MYHPDTRLSSTRILHVIGSVDPKSGGPIEGVLRQDAATRGIGIREIATIDPPDAPYLQGLGVKVHAFGEPVPPGPLASLRRKYGYAPGLAPWLRKNAERYDAVVVNGIWNASTWAASRALPGGAVPYFVYTHGMMDPWFRDRYPYKHIYKQISWWICEGHLLSNASSVLFTTEEECRLARNVFLGGKYRETVVGYGTAAAPPPTSQMEHSFRSKVPSLSDKFVLYLSRVHEKKGCDLLIRAFHIVQDLMTGVDLVIAGPGDPAHVSKLKRLAVSLGVQDRIHWPGMLSGDEKWGAYYAADAFILPSHQENFGIVVAEALSCGKPVLITDKVNIWREVKDGNAGLVARDTISGVVSLLSDWAKMPAQSKTELGRSALSVFRKHFDVENVGPSTLENIVRQAASSRRA